MVNETTDITARCFDHPLLTKVSELTQEIGSIRLLVVFPTKNGWGQGCPGGPAVRPDFCRLIQSVPEGAKHCKMCHVLMSVAACSCGLTEQCCHAGISVLVAPVPRDESGENMAVLSTCTFTSPASQDAWQEARERGKKLGINESELKQAFDDLPVLDKEQCSTIKELMAIAAEGVKEIKARDVLQRELLQSRKDTPRKGVVESSVEQNLKNYGTKEAESAEESKSAKSEKTTPVPIRVVEEMIRSRPDLPYTVGEISVAARMTPNHFSMLFHQYTGLTFSDFLTESRIEAAKEQLGDFTLNISEVSGLVGFDDPGYFSRRFRQVTGKSPTEWREKMSRTA